MTNLTFDRYAIGVIRDEDIKKPLGTTFVFVQPSWLVTAKHVVMERDIPRQRLEVAFADHYGYSVRVAFTHPKIDLAVLEIEYKLCERPLYPGHHSLSQSRPLNFVGYAPTEPDGEDDRVIRYGEIPTFDLELRSRHDGDEEVIIFPGDAMERGCSGGPILTSAGNVVGVIIEHTMGPGGPIARATSILPLVERLMFRL